MTQFDGLEPLAVETTSGVIAKRIRAAIVDGTLPPGLQLAEARLARHLAVSRGPVREAMQRLIQEGLLRSERHRGVFVVELGFDDVADVYLARAAVERAAVNSIVRRCDPTVIEALERVLDDMRRAAAADGWDDVARDDLRFHGALVAAAGSDRLLRMFHTLEAESRMCLTALEANYTEWQDLVAEHEAIADALRRFDRDWALALLDEHFESARRSLWGTRE